MSQGILLRCDEQPAPLKVDAIWGRIFACILCPSVGLFYKTKGSLIKHEHNDKQATC